MNLKELKRSLITSLKKSIKCIHKLEQRRDGPEDQGRTGNLAVSDPEIKLPANLESADSLDEQIRNVPFNNSSSSNVHNNRDHDDQKAQDKFEFDFKSIQEIEHSMWYIDEFDKRFTGFVEHLSDLSTYMQRKEFFFNK